MVKTPMASSNDEIFLVDGSGYIFRAYFALPPLTHNGMPVGAVLGFSSMLMKMLKDLNAPYIAVIFDAAKKNFRYDIYEDYKANREEAPEDLIPQFPLFRKASEAFGIPAIEVEGFEASNLVKVRDGLSEPCKPGVDRDCEGVSKNSRAAVSQRVAWLLTESTSLASELCVAAPELQAALGSDCALLTTRYLLAFAKNLGDPEILEGW